MLMENVISRVDSENIEGEKNVEGFIWYCHNCNTTHVVVDIEDYIDCDLRNPTDEYFYCPECDGDRVSLLRTGVNLLGTDKKYYTLLSDGTMLYLKDEEGKFWKVV